MGGPGERARLRHHPTLHRPARSPRDVQPGCRCGGRVVPLPLGGGVPVAHRPAAPGRRVDRGGLARHRAVLRVPPDERLRRTPTATASSSTWCATRPCSGPSTSARTRAYPRWSAGISTATGERSRRSGSTTVGRSSRASTNAVSGCPTGTATRSRSASPTTSWARRRGCSGTTSRRGRAWPAPSAAGASVSEAVFVPRAAGADESDGWVLLLVYSSDTDTSALHILNAEDVTAEPAGGHPPAPACAGGLPRELGARPGLTARERRAPLRRTGR